MFEAAVERLLDDLVEAVVLCLARETQAAMLEHQAVHRGPTTRATPPGNGIVRRRAIALGKAVR